MKPMNDEESRKFERIKMPWGKYKDEIIANVPLDYLLWLDDQPDFRRDLWKYLASERVQREMED